MTLLALETATSTCGVAVMKEGSVIAQSHLYRPRVHSERLTPLIEGVLTHGDVERDSLDAVAVSMGPGSYTGLRIGVSTAKGWVLATGADLVGVPTLDAFAARFQPVAETGDVVCPLLDARRDEVYAGAFRITETGLAEHAPTRTLPVEALSDWIGQVDGRLWVVGDGGGKAKQPLMAVEAPMTLVPPEEIGPSAEWVARRGRRRLEEEGPVDVDTFEPLYVKDVHATPAASPFA